ncbi:hypothetical protein NQ314_014720 [Rhamnusium bicolor]|uniref:Serine/threonine-protein kinase RIO1 n=1 Tax=Rhamnusium bicolor TaxID=1586634 RepID=A0AAV8X101_9CUCU|nr:hypothetical protein NQ314_014720 [Rhamnusium bicolor]
MATETDKKITDEELFCDVDDLTRFEDLNITDEDIERDEEDYSDYADDYDEEYDYGLTRSQHTNQQQISNKKSMMSVPFHTILQTFCLKTKNVGESDRIRTKDKHDRATAEQVMDPKTRMILFKLLNRNIITEINGCISTGKEANVYHASSKTGQDYAIKIYKTSILIFKDRDRYVSGEFRFRHGYCKHNPRKMVRTWAEKEMRNLVRMHSNGLNVPEPILLRSHVLLMSFIGKDGWPAPKLKDVELSQSKARVIYRDVVVIMWKLYNRCKLVHADLSEFNMLYQNGQVYIIDVSQSVEHDHPHSLEFLRKDCINITEYFKKKDVATMGIKELFDFITDPSINEENMEHCLDVLAERAAEKPEVTSSELADDILLRYLMSKAQCICISISCTCAILSTTGATGAEQKIHEIPSALKRSIAMATVTLRGLVIFEYKLHKWELNKERMIVEEEVFKQAYIPKRLTEVIDFERDINQAKSGIANDLVYKTLVGLKSDLSGTMQQPEILQDSIKEEESGDETIEAESSSEDGESKFQDSSRPRHETLDEKKARKKAFETAFKPKVLKNWEVPKLNCGRPRIRTGKTKIVANDRGHLLPEIKKSQSNPWGEYVGTWRLPKKIDRTTGKQETNKENIDDNIKAVPYVPGDLTEEHHRPPSYDELAADRFSDKIKETRKGFPSMKDDFSRPLPEPEHDLSEEVDNFYELHKQMVKEEYRPNRRTRESKKEGLLSPILAAISNFNLAKKLHKVNLEHHPLPDTITDSMYRKMQMQRQDKEPGLVLEDKNFAAGVGYKGYPGYGPTKCTKLKVYRPKTCGDIKHVKDDDSIGSFDKKWRFIRQAKVTPMDLAICWDLTPENPQDEPKRTTHIDEEEVEHNCDGVHGCAPLFEHGAKDGNEKDFFFDRPKTSGPRSRDSVKSEESSSKKRAKSANNLNDLDKHSIHSKESETNSKLRAKSAYNLKEIDKHSTKSKESSESSTTKNKFHQSTPNLSEGDKCSEKNCPRKLYKQPNRRLCVACELKNMSMKDKRPKSEYKMAFKAGIPQKNSCKSAIKLAFDGRVNKDGTWHLFFSHCRCPTQVQAFVIILSGIPDMGGGEIKLTFSEILYFPLEANVNIANVWILLRMKENIVDMHLTPLSMQISQFSAKCCLPPLST